MVDERSWRWSYEMGGLSEGDLAPDWLGQFRRWLAEAARLQVPEPNAMVLATAAPADGVATAQPSARTVLLRLADERGFTFYTNLTSRKGSEAAANPAGSAVFPWLPLQRQVVVVGLLERVSDAEADAYWASRPYGHRIGAIASPQSQAVADRAVLEERMAEAAARWPEGGPVPRPGTWGGLRLVPTSVEFWQGRRNRLHDRLRYRSTPGGWVVERLAP